MSLDYIPIPNHHDNKNFELSRYAINIFKSQDADVDEETVKRLRNDLKTKEVQLKKKLDIVSQNDLSLIDPKTKNLSLSGKKKIHQ